jgi:hypothetical protein
VDARQNFEVAMTCLPTAILQIKLITTGLSQWINSGEFDVAGYMAAVDLLVQKYCTHGSFICFSLLCLACFICMVVLIGVLPSLGSGWRPWPFRVFSCVIVLANFRFSLVLGVTTFISQWLALHKA